MITSPISGLTDEGRAAIADLLSCSRQTLGSAQSHLGGERYDLAKRLFRHAAAGLSVILLVPDLDLRTQQACLESLHEAYYGLGDNAKAAEATEQWRALQARVADSARLGVLETAELAQDSGANNNE